jgi:hypothetical protein
MSVTHTKRIAAVTVVATSITVFRADDFLVDGVLVASSETQEVIDIVAPVAEVADGKLALHGLFPAGSHLSFVVGSVTLSLDMADAADHSAIAGSLMLPPEIEMLVDSVSEPETFHTVIGFTEPSVFTDDPADYVAPNAVPVTSVTLTNVTPPVIPGDVRALIMEALQ